MRARFAEAWSVFFLSLLISSNSIKAETAIPAPSMESKSFAYEGDHKKDNRVTKHVWRRPPESTAAIITACGAGGNGGSAGVYEKRDYMGRKTKATREGSGGRASEVTSLFISSLTDTTYSIEVGEGGIATTFKGDKLNLTFPPGRNGANGGGVSDGETSIFGAGGKASKKQKVPGGGAESFCAGGGGGWVGGLGGNGYLTIQPMPNFEKLMRYIDEIAKQSKK